MRFPHAPLTDKAFSMPHAMKSISVPGAMTRILMTFIQSGSMIKSFTQLR